MGLKFKTYVRLDIIGTLVISIISTISQLAAELASLICICYSVPVVNICYGINVVVLVNLQDQLVHFFNVLILKDVCS